MILHRQERRLRTTLTEHIQDAQSGEVLRVLSHHNDTVEYLAITEDDKLIVTGSDDGVLITWDARTGARIHTCPQLPTEDMSSLALKGRLAAMGTESLVVVVDVDSGETVAELRDIKDEGIARW